MSIRARILLVFALVVTAGFYYLLDWVLDDVRPRYLESMEESLVDTAHLLAATLSNGTAKPPIDTGGLRALFDEVEDRHFEARIYDLVKSDVALRVYVTDAEGMVIFDSDHGRAEGEDYSQWNDVYLTLRGEYGARSTRTDPDDPASSVLHVAAPVLAEGQVVGVLTVGKPVVTSSYFITATRRKIMVAGFLALGLMLVLFFITYRWITRPIDKLTYYAKAVRDGKRMPLPELGKNEIGLMGSAMDEMRLALEGKDYAERYVRHLTHELKSPLAAVQGAAELLGEDMPPEQRARFLANIRNETGRMRDIIDRLLLLASLQKQTQLDRRDEVSLRELATRALEHNEASARQREINLELEADEQLTVSGDAFLLEQALSNLVDNAVQFSPTGASVRTVLSREAGRAVAAIEDRGPGIPEYARGRVFETFYSLPRPATGQKSSGLGLSFVQEIAELHGSSVTLIPREGGGTRAVLALPRI